MVAALQEFFCLLCLNDPGPLELQGSSGPWNENLAHPRHGGLHSTADFNLLILFLAFFFIFLHVLSPAHTPSAVLSSSILRCLEQGNYKLSTC